MSGWSFPKVEFAGSYSYSSEPKVEEGKVIEVGMKKLKDEADKWAGLMYQTDMVNWPTDQQTWKLFDRPSGMHVKPQPGGPFTFVQAKFVALPPATFTDSVSETQAMALPGDGLIRRKQTGVEAAGQGQVGDCWLVSAISALSEFDGEVKELFSTGELSKEGKYTFTLYDLPSKSMKEVTIDDRLACMNGNLLSLRPTADSEIWPLLLEKAFCVHAGGWDKIDGGQSTLAFVVFTGCTETFSIKHDNGTYMKLQPDWDAYEENNCHCNQARQGVRVAPWPNGEDKVDMLCEWDAENYVVCAGTGAGSDKNNTDGIVDGHAYSLISAKKQVCGKFDLLLFRNPHGQTEFVGGWKDGGPEWKAHPDVKAELGHKEDPDDGLFWMEKKDAFKYFHSFYVCCKKMDHDRIPKFENKSEDIKSMRKQDAGPKKDASIESIPPPKKPTPAPAQPQAVAPAAPAVAPVPAAPADAGWGGGGGGGGPKPDAQTPQEQMVEQAEAKCMDMCKGCTIC